MSSTDTMKAAEAEQDKAKYLQDQADQVTERARQQAEGMQRQAQDHLNEAQRLRDKATSEMQDEKHQAEKEAEENKGGVLGSLF